ncbi:MAG: hypothetical protein ACR2F8_06385 [Caulobacteraceae bacterium]
MSQTGVGSSFADLLGAEGIREEVEERSIKALITDKLHGAMKAEALTKVAMARRIRAIRQQLDRLLDPKNPSVTLSTSQRAANALGRSLTIELR